MNRQGLPGIEDLFREQDRLAKKLSQEELNALRRYLQKAVHTECESVVARMRYLQTAHDVNEIQFQQALKTLQKDLNLQQTVASEFRREFGSLARVLHSRELRYQARHETLVRQVVQGRESVKEALEARDEMETKLQHKEKELNQQKDMVVDLEDELANHKDCHKIREEMDRLHKDLLKVKLDNDKLRKELAETTAKLDRATVRKVGLPRTVTHTKNSSYLPEKNHVRFTPSVLAPKNSPVTFTPVTPYCTSNTCRARQDLEECRVQFIKKCEEVVYLKTALSEQKAKTSRERTHVFPSSPSMGKPSVAVHPLKPAYHKGIGKDFASLPGTRLAAAEKLFKFGPVFPPTDKK